MSMTQESTAERILKKQWSFFWAGIVFGVAQIIYIVTLWIQNWSVGKEATSKPITVTTDLGKMFRGMEVWLSNTFGYADTQLYGAAIDGLASTGGAFVPGVGWPIVGMMVGGWLVARVERESRSWVKYSPKLLLISFLGGIIFSYGTRLAGGCTLNHLLGGIPMMSIHSTVTVVFMAIGGALGFLIMARLKLADNFKHQETKSYVCDSDAGERTLYDPDYQPRRRPIYWLALTFLFIFFGVAVVGGLFNPESLQHLKGGNLVAFSKSVDHKSWLYVIGTMIAGIIAGFAMAKSGFGTECALVSAETAGSMTKKDSFYAKLGVPRITRTLMRGYLPIIGLSASWVVMLAFIWGAWAFFDIRPAFEGGLKYQLTAGSIIGGLLLGAGAVLLIGCEIRSYMRIGLGYLNTWVGFMGFAVGYLPFTLYYSEHKAFLLDTRMVETYKWYQLVFPENILGQQSIMFVWLLLLTALVYLLVRKGMYNTGMSRTALLFKNTEDLQRNIDDEAKQRDGKVGEVTAPVPVPAS